MKLRLARKLARWYHQPFAYHWRRHRISTRDAAVRRLGGEWRG